jgi:hypothetical protein
MKYTELDYVAYDLYVKSTHDVLTKTTFTPSIADMTTFMSVSKRHPNNIHIKRLYDNAKIELRKQKLKKLKL